MIDLRNRAAPDADLQDMIEFAERLRGGPRWDVLVASKGDRCPEGLNHLPGNFRYLLNMEPGWAHAANTLFDQAERDVLFIDDDVTLTPTTFALLGRYWDKADVFGPTLLYEQPERGIQSAGYVFGSDGQLYPRSLPIEVMQPSYVPHVTASCMVIKREVLAAGIRFPEWPGTHSEDVAFTLDCWLRGFRVMCLPGVAFHAIDGGVGATKRFDPHLQERLAMNKQCLREWMGERDVQRAVAKGRIPFGSMVVKE